MKRNCNLELCLFPYTASLPSNDSGDDHQPMKEERRDSPQQNQQPQQLTIFYNGKICVSDVTEIQARSILMLATREMEERLKTPTGSDLSSPTMQTEQYSPSTGLSMKRSLQRFLQKRKNRLQATSPY
ncbi:hypothetical protein ACJW31_05G128000 [Castanea mollissima]